MGSNSVFSGDEFEALSIDKRSGIICENDECDGIINCDNNNTCSNSFIKCPLNKPCNITCNTPESCKNAAIRCPLNNLCNIKCIDEYSCHNTTIYAKESSSFTLKNCSLSYKNCDRLKIYFPPLQTGESPKSNIEYDTNTEISAYNSMKDKMIMFFYAINGWNDLNDYNHITSHGIMYCTPYYEQFCYFGIGASSKWGCNGSADICNNPPSLSPSTSPRYLKCTTKKYTTKNTRN